MSLLYRLLTLAGSALVVPALVARSIGDSRERRHLGERLGRIQPWIDDPPAGRGAGANQRRPGTRRIWIQAVSVGEVRTAETFVRALKEALPDVPVALSATTAAGIERAAKLAAQAVGAPLIDRVFAYPLDLPSAVSRALDAVNPSAYGAVETEIWPALLSECRRRGIPCFIVNGSISERSARRYRFVARAMREGLGAVRAACMQSEADAMRIVDLGAPRGAVVVTGNIKYDARTSDLEDRVESLRQVMALPHGTPVMIAGSTAHGEEEIVVRAFRRAAADLPGLVLIVAPRHRERFDEAAASMKRAGARVLRRSLSTGMSPPRPGDAILLDTIGELEAAYALAHVAFVGGSLVPRGGQNPLEPARLGVPVLFGPGMDNFRDVASALIDGGGAFEVRDERSLAESAVRLFRDAAAHDRASQAARRFVAAHVGATRRTVDALAGLIPEVFA